MAVSDAEFGKLLEEIAPQLESYVLQTTGSQELAENLTRGTIYKAWQARERWSGQSFRAWIFRILHNHRIDEARKWERQNVVATDQIDEIAVDPINATPGDLAMMHEEIREIWSKLSEEHRQVILLVGVHGHSAAEAAEMLRVAEGTVTSRLTRAHTMAKRHRAELES